jgi:hypothetical protein
MHAFISLFITFFGYFTRRMASDLPVSQPDFEKKASIISTIVLDFDFPNKAASYTSVQLSTLAFQCVTSVHADDIQMALNTKIIRDELTKNYNLAFTSHKDNGNGVNGSTVTRWKIQNPLGGVLRANLDYEFSKDKVSVSKGFSKEERFQAICSRLKSKDALLSSTPSLLGIRSSNDRPFGDMM